MVLAILIIPPSAHDCGRIVVDGAVAQLGERLHGMQEVVGSIPISSTFHILRPVRAVLTSNSGKKPDGVMTCPRKTEPV